MVQNIGDHQPIAVHRYNQRWLYAIIILFGTYRAWCASWSEVEVKE